MDEDSGLNLDYGFLLDNVTSTRSLHGRNPNRFQPFRLLPSPEFHPFPEEEATRHLKSDFLLIDGANVDKAVQEFDVIVRIGQQFCDVISVFKTQLACKPPPEQPLPMGGGFGLPQVVVSIGSSHQFEIGYLQY